MDVHLLSRLLKELIIDNDRIALPGMGYFQAEPMPAYFSEDGKTIYPPSKRISFKWDDKASGDMLATYYTKVYGIDRNTADIELDTFFKQLKPMLHERKFIDFPGVGRLKLTACNSETRQQIIRQRCPGRRLSGIFPGTGTRYDSNTGTGAASSTGKDRTGRKQRQKRPH